MVKFSTRSASAARIVAAVPGEDFGAPGRIRISYALEVSRVKEALERMAKFVGKK